MECNSIKLCNFAGKTSNRNMTNRGMTLRSMVGSVLIALLVLLVSQPVQGQKSSNEQFTIVLDAGHGGRDSGALGVNNQEKAINLNIVLKIGELIEKNNPDIKVIYTRENDKFVKLEERARIANRSKGHLFISVHCNSLDLKNKRRTKASGASTYVLGTAKNDENLAVAQRENSVIMLEDDYNTKYEGFDPNSPESYIIFETMQNVHFDQSVLFADMIQDELSSVASRKDDGVKQGGFYLLAYTSMPAVIIELDFICNPTIEKYLASNKGQDKLAQSVYNAIVAYKKSYDNKVASTESRMASNDNSGNSTTAVEATQGPVYKIQFMALPRLLGARSSHYKGLSPVEVYRKNGKYIYTYGTSTTREGIEDELKQVKKLFKDAFVVVIDKEEKVR